MPASSSATAELTEHLSREFAPALAREVVAAEVAMAERELDGQIPAGAVDELLHRLVVCRLRLRTEGRS